MKSFYVFWGLLFSMMLCFSFMPADAHIQDGLVAWWKMDEGTGTTSTADSSGNGRAGTLTGHVPTWVGGVRGPYALNFDGSSQYVVSSTALPAIASNGAQTVSAWVKTTDSFGGIFSGRNSGNDNSLFDFSIGFNAIINNAGTVTGITRYDDGSGLVSLGGTKVVNDGYWHQVAMILDQPNSTIRLYVDGVLTDSTGVGSGSITSSSDETSIGVEKRWVDTAYGTADQRYLSGSIDDVRVYNRALSAQEIASLYKNGVQIKNAVIKNAVVNK